VALNLELRVRSTGRTRCASRIDASFGTRVGVPSLVVLQCGDRGHPIDTRTPLPWVADLPHLLRFMSAPSFEMPDCSRVTDTPPEGDPGATLALGAVALVGGGEAFSVGGGGTVAGESNSLLEDPGRTPNTGARPPPGAGRTSTLMDPLLGGRGAHPSLLDGQRRDGAPHLSTPRGEAVHSASGTVVCGPITGPGPSRHIHALSLKGDQRKSQELQRAFEVTPEDLAQARSQRATRNHW